MAIPRVAVTAVLLVLCWRTHRAKAQSEVTITVDYTTPPDFPFPPGSNEYRTASGPLVYTCRVDGEVATGVAWTSDCDCPLASSTTNPIARFALTSGDTGTHTCTVSAGSASITVNIVGAGIHIFRGRSSPSSGAGDFNLPNNGLVIALSTPFNGFRFRIFCRSDSMMENVGDFIGLDGSSVSTGGPFFVQRLQAGEITVENRASDDVLDATQQGVYTCRIPDTTGVTREINVGVYTSTFNDRPTVTSPLVFTPGSSSSTLTCTSTTSIATIVTFTRDGTTVGPLRDGESMMFGGVTYELTQTVTDRRASTFDNVLTINQPLADIVGSSFSCSVTNSIGTSTASDTLEIMDDRPTITNPLVFTPGSSSSTLTCTSTDSPAITVTFVRDGTTVGPLRDGESMTVDRVTYQLAQTVSNRRAFTYENVLTITEERSSLAGSTFTCTVYNYVGPGNSQSFLIPAVLTVHITVTRTDPSGFTPGSDIEYRAASGPHTFTCTAEGGAGSGAYQYVWTSNSSTFSTSPPNGVIIRQAVHSGDIGTHTCTASRGGESGSANTVVTIADDELFQVQVGVVEHCVKWSSEKAKTVESSIQNAIVEVVELHCKCKFLPSRIVSGQFSCRTTTTRVTYRSTIIGIVGYNASQLLDILQDWVDSGPIIKVDWLLLDVYASCQVHISSLSVPECSTIETQPFGDPTLITSNPTVIQCVHVCLVRTEGHGICGV